MIDDTIDDKTMVAAISVARWFVSEAARVYTILGESPAAAVERTLVDVIRAKGGMISVRDLSRSTLEFNERGGALRAAEALQSLVDADLAHWEDRGKTKVCAINRLEDSNGQH